MKYKRAIIIICSLVFFLTALTFYVNRVIFPQLIKKIAIQHIEETTHRHVEIGAIHFNWIKGIIIDRVKIYEKDPQFIFAQADQISFGVLVFPGMRHIRITIPFINVRSPQVHLVRTARNQDIWNFSDMLSGPTNSTSTPTKTNNGPAMEIAWGGITVTDGKVLVDDFSRPQAWSEYFDNINLKLSLSYKGIDYDFTTNIPNKNGFIGATVYYQPITKDTEAHIRLKNIDTASYLSLVNIPDLTLDSGVIKDIDLTINTTKEKIAVQGDILMDHLDISSNGQSFKGNINIHGLDAQYQEGNISAHGAMALSHMVTKVPGLSAGGSVEARVGTFELSKDGVNFNGSLNAQNIFIDLSDRRVKAQAVSLDNIKVRKDIHGVQSIGSANLHGLFVQWPQQKLQGDITLKDVSMRFKDENDIQLQGNLTADNFSTHLGEKSFSSDHLELQGARLKILDQQNIYVDSPLSIDGMQLSLGVNQQLYASAKADKLSFSVDNNIVKVATTLNASQAKLILGDKSIEASPQLELNLTLPINDPNQMSYSGSITLSDGIIHGLGPIASLSNIELDVDFQNDEATINALNANILDTNVKINGTIHNFKQPFIDVLAEANELNLTKLGELFPQIVKQYDLNFKGTSFVKVKFQGLAADPLSGKILAVASFKDVAATSRRLHQSVKNITGILEVTPHSLLLRDTTAVYQDKKYTLGGSIEDFKSPKILATLSGPGLQIQADLIKMGDSIKIHAIKGRYLNTDFNSSGNIDLFPGQAPYFNIHSDASFLLENFIKILPEQQKKDLAALNLTGMINISADIKGSSFDWKNVDYQASITSPLISLMNYKLNDIKFNIIQTPGKIKNATFDGQLYQGTVHGVGSMNLLEPGMPYELALNIDGTDLHQLKMDSPLKMNEINGKFYLTTVAHGTINDLKNNLQATGSFGIRDGYLAEFDLFRGLLSALNDALRLGQVMITDVDGNFTIANQKFNTDNLRLKGPTIVLLTKGWVNFDQYCDLDVNVDLSSGVVPAVAHDVLNTLDIRIYDKISHPKFKKKISMPQVINTLLKNFLE